MKPKMPKWDSQCWYILHWIMVKPITPLEALEHCGCFRLSERIRELEALGWLIDRKPVKQGGKRFMSYELA